MITIEKLGLDSPAASGPPIRRRPSPDRGRWGVDEPDVWLVDEDPRTALAALLHTEVGHTGACYGRRAAVAAVLAIPIGAAGAAGLALGGQVGGGGHALAAHYGPLVLLAMVVACVVTVVGWHAMWHRDEAPTAGNVLLGVATEVFDDQH
jgi:hypothetical protein